MLLNAPPSQVRAMRSVRLDDAKIAQIMSRLAAEDEKHMSDRRHQRYGYSKRGVLVHLHQPGASGMVAYSAPTYDLAEQGMSILHGGFVHIGTRCKVQLVTTHGAWQDVTGKVVRCRYVDGGVHLVGVQFDQTIDPAVYCPSAIRTRVLFVDDDAAVRRLASHHLETLNAQVELAENGKIAIEKALAGVYDLVIIDVDMPEMDGLTATRELRKRGYSGIIVAMTGMTGPGDRERCVQAGCNQYVPKPFGRQTFATLITASREEPLISTFQDDPTMTELVTSFVNELPAKVRQLEEAVAAKDVARLQSLARSLKAQGSGFGFQPITDAAASLESGLIAQQPLEAVQSVVDRLLKLCLQAHPGG